MNREPDILLAKDAGIFPGWLLTDSVYFSNRNPANRPPEEIKARILEALGVDKLPRDSYDPAYYDWLVDAARNYALSMTRREAWRAAKEDSLEQESDLSASEEMLSLHGPEAKRAAAAIEEARTALEALPAPARELLDRELRKTLPRPLLEGLEAAQRILAGHFSPYRGRPRKTGRVPEGVKELVQVFGAASSLLLGHLPTQGQLNNLVLVFVNEPNRKRYLSEVKRWLGHQRQLDAAKADPEP